MEPALKQSIKRKLAHTLDLPSEILLDQATIHLMGDAEVHIINHKGLVKYSRDSIKTRAKQGMIEVIGNNLEIASFSASEIRISGKLRQVMLS